MKYLFTILFLLYALFFFSACSTLDKTFQKEVLVPVLDVSGNQVQDAEGNPVFTLTYENTSVTNAGLGIMKAIPYVGEIASGLLAAGLLGLQEWRKRKVVQLKDGTIKELEDDKTTLQKSLEAVAVARDMLWNWADGIAGGQLIIAKFDEFVNSEAGKNTTAILQFVQDTLAKAQTPDQVAGALVKLEDLAKAEA